MATLTRIPLNNGTYQVKHRFYLGETATNADGGTVSYVMKRLDGTSVQTGSATTTGTTGEYAVTIATLAAVDFMTITFTGTFSGATIVDTDYVEICGGHLVSLAQIRNTKPVLDTVRFTTDDLIVARLKAEQEAEGIIGRALTPRFARFAVDGNNDFALMTYVQALRAIRACSVFGVALTGSGLTNIEFSESGVFSRRGAIWLWGRRNILLEVEHGDDSPPEYVVDSLIARSRFFLAKGESKIPARAVSFSAQDGGSYRLATPSGLKTGMPDVDAAYERATYEGGGFA